MDGGNGITQAVFICHLLISSFFQVLILLELLGDGDVKAVTVRKCMPL